MVGQIKEHEVGMHHRIKITIANKFPFYPAKSKKENEDQKERPSIIVYLNQFSPLRSNMLSKSASLS